MSVLVRKQEGGLLPYRRPSKRDVEPFPSRWYAVLSLHLTGRTAHEISELVGLGEQQVYRILNDERIIQVRQQLLNATSDEFEALFPKVVEVIRETLQSKDERVQLEAVNIWMKAHGKFQPAKAEGQVVVTAEDVVIQILNQGVPDA